MAVETRSFSISTKGNSDILDVTNKVADEIVRSSIVEGHALIFVSGSTAGITTIEFEPGLKKDYPEFFERIIPSGKTYHHDNTWHDGNGHSHIRSSLQGTSFTIPFVNKKLLLGTWQQIILIDFDNRPRSREIIVQLNGKKVNE
ncbi:MAG TPA: secondary thiamine-phosphate synthase enzyme YjbQ [Ignavibacteriaceae bacterium]|nr:secondary thiamine-phosphate synthase enzyme YjbQ [Ignavibacteriaceae bacterium]